MSPHAFVAASRGATIARTRKTGTTVSYVDTEAALTTFIVLRAEPGVRRGGRCVNPGKRTKRGPRCMRYLAVARFGHMDVAARNSFHFTGRVSGRTLRPGTYRLVATPRLGAVRGASLRAGFRILP